MILTLMDQMMALLSGNVVYACAGAFLWGLASVVLSPCHLSSIPLVMAFVGKESKGEQKRAALLSIVFTIGIFVTMALLGLLTAALGRLWGDVGSWTNLLGAGIFILLGLFLLNVFSLPQMSINQDRFKNGGLWAAFALGILFGTVLGPCAFAFLMPVLGLVIVKAGSDPFLAGGLILSYAVGHGIVIVLAGTFSAGVMSFVQSPRFAPLLRWIRKGLGLLALGIGVWFLLN